MRTGDTDACRFGAGMANVRVEDCVAVYSDSSERLNDLTVRVRSLLANSAATGFITHGIANAAQPGG